MFYCFNSFTFKIKCELKIKYWSYWSFVIQNNSFLLFVKIKNLLMGLLFANCNWIQCSLIANCFKEHWNILHSAIDWSISRAGQVCSGAWEALTEPHGALLLQGHALTPAPAFLMPKCILLAGVRSVQPGGFAAAQWEQPPSRFVTLLYRAFQLVCRSVG